MPKAHHTLLISDEEIIGFSSLNGAINYARMRYGVKEFTQQTKHILVSEVNVKNQQVKIEIISDD